MYTLTTYPTMDLSFDDVLLNPAFSMVRSRSDVNLDHEFLGSRCSLPIMNANMDTIASPQMVNAIYENGGTGVLHRFQSVEENIKQFRASEKTAYISVGLGGNELERAEALASAGAVDFMIDVAHGAAIQVVEQYDRLRGLLGPDRNIVVGNFANAQSVKDFHYHSTSPYEMDAAKIGIGGGSMCTTRIVTGCGRSTLSSLLDCTQLGIPLIADGGLRTSGDIAKALAAGASAVMLGGMLAGTAETPGETQYQTITGGLLTGSQSIIGLNPYTKMYRGSASKESYEAQGKASEHRTAEGESTIVPYKGPVKDVLQQIRAGLLSSLSYVGASNLAEFRERSHLIQISNATKVESGAHGVKR